MANVKKINVKPLRPNVGETSQEWVFRALRFAIMTGQVQPGQAITIRAIAAMLGVSAMPVREALKRLVAEGALVMKVNRRIVVPSMDQAKLTELLELRIALEIFAGERAFPYVDDALIDQLIKLDDEQNKAIERNDPTGTILKNQELHRTLYVVHPNPVSMPAIERVWLQMGPLHRIALATLQDHYMVDRHAEMITALKERNLVGLKVAIEADIRDGAGFMTQKTLLDKADDPNLAMPKPGYTDMLTTAKPVADKQH